MTWGVQNPHSQINFSIAELSVMSAGLSKVASDLMTKVGQSIRMVRMAVETSVVM